MFERSARGAVSGRPTSAAARRPGRPASPGAAVDLLPMTFSWTGEAGSSHCHQSSTTHGATFESLTRTAAFSLLLSAVSKRRLSFTSVR